MCPLESFENCTVDLLIDLNTRTWNEGLIDGLFMEEDAELIKKIPLSWAAIEDTLYWPYSTLGHYTCKSGNQRWKQANKPHQFMINRFGRRFGNCKFLQKLKISFGMRVVMFFLQNKRCWRGKSQLTRSVRGVILLWRSPCTLSSFAQSLERFGLWVKSGVSGLRWSLQMWRSFYHGWL